MILYIDLLNTMLGFSLSISFVYKCMNCMTLFYQLTKSIHYPSSQNLLCELQNVCVQSQWMCMLWTGEERLPAGDGGSGGAGHRPEARLSGDQVRSSSCLTRSFSTTFRSLCADSSVLLSFPGDSTERWEETLWIKNPTMNS